MIHGRVLSAIQPSFLPWRGFFKIIAQSDVHVFYDDVQYDKHGWRNRNRLYSGQGLQWMTVPVLTKGKMGQKINETEIDNSLPWQRKILGAISASYQKSEFFNQFYDWLDCRLKTRYRYISDLNWDLTCDVCRFLSLEAQLKKSSDFCLRAEDRVERLVELCLVNQCDTYLSGPSAKDYISQSDKFSLSKIAVCYEDYYGMPSYSQLHKDFKPEVSILDTLMNCGDSAKVVFGDSIRSLSSSVKL